MESSLIKKGTDPNSERRRIRQVYRRASARRKASSTLDLLDSRLRVELGLTSSGGTLTRQELIWIAHHLKLQANSRLLDVACGDGQISRFITRETGAVPTGLDIIWESVSRAARAAPLRQIHSKEAFILADASDALPFPGNAFSGSVLIDALVHFTDPRALFDELRRVLEPRGRFVICTIIGKELTLQENRLLEETTATLHLLGRGELLSLLDATGFSVTAEKDRTRQLQLWHRNRYDALRASETKIRGELPQKQVNLLLSREQVTVELLEERRWRSLLIAARKD